MTDKDIGLLGDEVPITELDEFSGLIAEGQERGFLTFEQLASSLEENDVSKEQIQELHAYLDEQGIEIVDADGQPARADGNGVEASAVQAIAPQPDQPRRPEIDLTVEPSLDSLRLYLRAIGRVDLLTAARASVPAAGHRPLDTRWRREGHRPRHRRCAVRRDLR